MLKNNIENQYKRGQITNSQDQNRLRQLDLVINELNKITSPEQAQLKETVSVLLVEWTALLVKKNFINVKEKLSSILCVKPAKPKGLFLTSHLTIKQFTTLALIAILLYIFYRFFHFLTVNGYK